MTEQVKSVHATSISVRYCAWNLKHKSKDAIMEVCEEQRAVFLSVFLVKRNENLPNREFEGCAESFRMVDAVLRSKQY